MEILYFGFSIFLIALAFLTILMPFFVLKIRNEIISMNVKLSKLIELTGGEKQEDQTQMDGNRYLDLRGRSKW